MSDRVDPTDFTPLERTALAVCRFANENSAAKRVQQLYHRYIGEKWVHAFTRNLLHVEGADKVAALDGDARSRGVLLCANHRSFFDQYIVTCVLMKHARWLERVYFPVRANFFYDSWSGLAVNLLIGGLVMYPPIYRQPWRAPYNRQAITRVIDLLTEPGVLVGMHPEGTRGKGPDPYELLPAQPGVGEVIMKARPIVMPVFVNGLSNDLPDQIAGNFRSGARRGPPITVVFGDPVDFGDLLQGTPRPAQYKRVADRALDGIRALGPRERAFRESLA